MSIEKKSVFISYRTKSGWELANLIQNYLSSRNIPVFFDKEDIKGGQKWKKVLSENISKCSVFIPVLYGDSHDYQNKKDDEDWLWWEINLALSTPNVKVLPIIAKNFKKPMNLPEKYQKMMNKIFDWNGKAEVDQGNCLMILGKLYKDVRRYMNSLTRDDNVIYSQNNINELDNMLNKDKEFFKMTKKIDDAISNSISDDYDELYVLDLGCSDAHKSKMLFGNNGYKIKKLIGIDNSQHYIDLAQSKVDSKWKNHFKFFKYNLRDRGCKDYLQNLAEKELPDNQKFNVICISMLLLHLAEPYRIIEIAKSLLSKDGTIVISDIDDNFSFYYPDPLGWIEEFNRLKKESRNNGNRSTGREIYAYLNRAGFLKDNIKVRNVLIPITNNLTYDDKVDRFEAIHKQLIDEFTLKNKEEYQLFYYEAINWLETCKEDLKKAFGDVEFSTQSYIVITAKNN